MNQNEREDVSFQTNAKLLGIRFMIGLQQLHTDIRKLLVVLVFIVLEISFATMLIGIARNSTFMFGSDFVLKQTYFSTIILSLIGLCFLIVILGTPWCSVSHRLGLKRGGFVNKAQEAPALLKVTKGDCYVLYEYYTTLTLRYFVDNKEALEACLNIAILDIYYGKNRNRIIIKAASGDSLLPTYIEWNDKYMPSDYSKVALGMNVGNNVRVLDFQQSPHVFCGGQTGGGKTGLLYNVLHQCKIKGYKIFLIDFKLFVDFRPQFIESFTCIDSKVELNNTLEMLIDEMNNRKVAFKEADCTNIEEFNDKYPFCPYERILVACDEIAYAFMKKGTSNEEKRLTEEITHNMSIIAQQGRFAGITLWLSTQRGDADTIPPQVRSNLTYRICARASKNLSEVTVEHTLAAEIPLAYKGRFVDENENFFQAFYFERDKQ